MAKHAFGGLWTAQKLAILREYLNFFTVALSSKPFRLVYIDTFAGSGKCLIKVRDGRQNIDGSARIALDIPRPFDEYFFIEARRKHVAALQELQRSHPHGGRVTVWHGDAREHLDDVLAQHQWAKTRGVLFLDPYGLQCTWDMVKSVAATQALDVFFLVSVFGLTRQAARSASKVDAEKAEALDRFLGTTEWRTALYAPPPQQDLFKEPTLVRERGSDAIIQFVHRRMSEAFAHVEAPVILRNQTNAPLYAFFFAVSNPSSAAVQLAAKVGREILSKLR